MGSSVRDSREMETQFLQVPMDNIEPADPLLNQSKVCERILENLKGTFPTMVGQCPCTDYWNHRHTELWGNACITEESLQGKGNLPP